MPPLSRLTTRAQSSPIQIATTVLLWGVAFVFALVFNLGSPSDAVLSAERRFNRDAESVTVASCRIEGREAYVIVRVIGPGARYLEVPYEARRLGGIWEVHRGRLTVEFARGDSLMAMSIWDMYRYGCSHSDTEYF